MISIFVVYDKYEIMGFFTLEGIYNQRERNISKIINGHDSVYFVFHGKTRQDKERHKSIQCWVGVELFNLYVRTTLYQRGLRCLLSLLIQYTITYVHSIHQELEKLNYYHCSIDNKYNRNIFHQSAIFDPRALYLH